MGGGSGMPIDSVLCCAVQIDSYEAGGRVGVDGTQWAHRARVLDPPTHPSLLLMNIHPRPTPKQPAEGPHTRFASAIILRALSL